MRNKGYTFNNFCNFFALSRETSEKISLYYQILKRWSKIHNLIQERDLTNFWLRHAADCAQLIQYLSSNSIYDLGTGAGLPGIILSIIMPNNVYLLESNHKKIVFLKHVISQLKLKNCSIIPGRIEDNLVSTDPCPYITARAFASLSMILELTQVVSRETAPHYFLHKTRSQFSEEANMARDGWHFHYQVNASVTHSEGLIIHLFNVGKK